MEKNIDETLITIEYAERKGEGFVTIANPLRFSHGLVTVKVGYTPKDMDSSIHLICLFDDEYKDAYEDDITFYSNDIQLMTIHVKNHDLDKYVGKNNKDKMMEDILHYYNPERLMPIVKASNLNLRIISHLRKIEDVKIEGNIMADFQKALQSLIDIFGDKKLLLNYISQHDDSFKSINKLQDQQIKEEKEKIKKEEQKQKAKERKEQRERAAAEELAKKKVKAKRTTNVIWIMVLLLSICAIILSIAYSSSKLFWIGFAGFIASISALMFTN